MIKSRPGRKMVKGTNRTVAQQKHHEYMKSLPVVKLVGDMNAQEFAVFAALNPDHKMVQFRLKKEGK